MTVCHPLIASYLPQHPMTLAELGAWLDGELLNLLAASVDTNSENLALVLNQKKELAPSLASVLDEIIVQQAVGFGTRILLSHLAYERYLQWETQPVLLRRFHQAVESFAKIKLGHARQPLQAGLKQSKKESVAILNLIFKRLRAIHKRSWRSQPSNDLILQTFDRLAAEASCPPSLRIDWFRFLAEQPAIVRRLHQMTATQFFDEWSAVLLQRELPALAESISRLPF